jgi:ATP-dependent Clp protease ATP-binding subunit ClpA
MSSEIPSGPLDEMQEIHQWVTSMFERFTETARRVIFFARYEAAQFGSTIIETEHVLLALLREDKNLISRFLRTSNEVVRKEIEDRTTIRQKVSTDIGLPMSNECKRILLYTADEADRLNHLHIGTEHLLLAILREEKCFAAEILHERGLRLNAIRDELARSPMSIERGVSFLPHEMGSRLELPESGLVPDAATAKRIAEAEEGSIPPEISRLVLESLMLPAPSPHRTGHTAGGQSMSH